MGVQTNEIPSEVRRRTLGPWVVAIAVMAVAILGAYALGTLKSPKQSGCVQSDYGTQCVRVAGTGLTVTGIAAQFSTFPDFFGQHDWKFETTTYTCDPRGKTKSECAPERTAYGSTHHANPHDPPETVCTREGDIDSTLNCSPSLNFPVPTTFDSSSWLCTEVAVHVDGEWVDNAAGLRNGERACEEVH